jgi:hypothetical protein
MESLLPASEAAGQRPTAIIAIRLVPTTDKAVPAVTSLLEPADDNDLFEPQTSYVDQRLHR